MLVTRELIRKRAAEEAAVKKALDIAAEIKVPSEVLMKESSAEAAQKVVELIENLQQMVKTSDVLKADEDVQMEKATTSEADASEAVQGNTDSLHFANIVEIESSSESPSTSTSDSSNLDDVPLNRIYTSINKSLSPSTKLKKKPSNEPYEPLYPSVLERIGEMSQMRVDLCAKLTADHPFQPPVIECLQSIPADAEGVDEPAGSVSANISTPSHPNQLPVIKPLNFAPADAETIGEQVGSEFANLVETSSPQPKSSSKSSEPSVLDHLVNHYSSELPGVESKLEKAFKVACGEVALESPQQQTPNLQTASTTIPVVPDHIEFLSFIEQISEP